MKIHLVDAFTTDIGKGNRAGVVFDADNLNEQQMQDMAAFANVSETAFIIGSKTPESHDVHVRYFTPTQEVPICGHATIATHFLRARHENMESGQVISKTGAGILPVDIDNHGGTTKVVMTQGTPEIGATLDGETKEKLIGLLGLHPNDLIENLPVQIVSTGHSKVMIPIKDKETLHTLSPDQAGLAAFSEDIGSNGFFVFTIEDDTAPYKTHGRMFAPAIGIEEDPVTGNANGPAGLYLAYHGILSFDDHYTYRGIQGEAIGKPGVVEVSISKENGNIAKIQVAGTAVVADTLDYAL